MAPTLMSEYPGYLPWYLGGDPYFTYDELNAVIADFNRRAKERRKQQQQHERSMSRRRGRRR